MTIDVLKFGGTSVADAAALRSVLDIVSARSTNGARLLVVLSATAGTTNALLELAAAAAQQSTSVVVQSLQQLRERHLQIVSDLIPDSAQRTQAHAAVSELCDNLDEYCHGLSLLGECSPQSFDEVVAYGERLSTTIVAQAARSFGISAAWLDVRHVMRTDATYQQAAVDMDATERQWAHRATLFTNVDVVVTQGFIGAAPNGTTTTLGRGGSDYSAAILGAVCGARIIDIFTDVSGVLSADPRLVPSARPIATIDVAMMRELALYGAKVLHPDTILPATSRNIPVRVVNTFEPSAQGTLITAGGTDVNVVAVTGVRQCVRLAVAPADAPTVRNALARRHLTVLLHCSTLTSESFVVQRPNDVTILDIESAVADASTVVHECSMVVACSNVALHHATAGRALAELPDVPVSDVTWFPHGKSVALCVPPSAYSDVVLRLHQSLLDA